LADCHDHDQPGDRKNHRNFREPEMTARRDCQFPPEKQALKQVAKALVRAAGGVEAAEEITGRSKTQLSAYGNINAPEFMPVDAIAALEGVTHGHAGHPIVTRLLATRAGYTLVKLPAAAPDCGDWHRAIGSLSKEVGDAVQAVCSSLSDDTPGKVTAQDVRERGIIAEIDEAIEKLVAMRALAVCAGEA
jgi:hypothetical protein